MKTITVTSPLFPPLDEINIYLEDIWNRKWLTNNGYYHQKLEQELCKYLDVPYISLYSNGTLALIAALEALNLQGEVITTPYSFVATSHAIIYNHLSPVFVDVDPKNFNLDPTKIENAITEKTCAILPVHVYGQPCDHQAIKVIADKYGLPIIYDAAHAFGVRQKGESVLKFGDLSILSFHATKTYSTIEGGAIICHTKEMKDRLDKLKNFGYTNEIEINTLGMNAKLNEVQAAYGLASLNYIDSAIESRKKVAEFYYQSLQNIKGISMIKMSDDIRWNYSYFPIFVDENIYFESRDSLYERLRLNNILSRRYFYPLITDFKVYEKYNNNTPIAKKISNNVICLPIHHELSIDDLLRIEKTIKNRK